jgi:Fe-S cluster assembly iron-binding protein IscA
VKTIYSLIIALVLAACGSTQKTSHTARDSFNSVNRIEVIKLDTIVFAKAQVAIKTPLQALNRDTTITATTKQAQATIKVVNGQLKATCTCDSLQRVVVSSRVEIERLKSDLFTAENKEVKAKGYGMLELIFAILFLVALIIILIKLL